MALGMVRASLVSLCIVGLTLSSVPLPAFAQRSDAITGTMAGQVYEESSRTAMSGVTVIAQRITSNERFAAAATDARGSYFIPSVPPGIYAFYLEYEGEEFSVVDHFDVRTGVDFLLESCFQLDHDAKAATLIQECRSGLYADAQVVTLGPHRFYRPAVFDAMVPQEQENAEEDLAQITEVTVTHLGADCMVNEQFPRVDAIITPPELVQSSRVYFRAAQHPDFYYVVMQQTEGDNFMAVLPRPSPETTEIIYYIEAVDMDFNNATTPEYDPDITDEDDCERAAYFTGAEPSIVVGATVGGAAAVPIGFQAAGIAGFVSATGVVTTAVAAAAAGGAAGGIGAVGTVLIVSGAAVGGGGIIAGVTDETEASPPQ